jgi:hypothetical protein
MRSAPDQELAIDSRFLPSPELSRFFLLKGAGLRILDATRKVEGARSGDLAFGFPNGFRIRTRPHHGRHTESRIFFLFFSNWRLNRKHNQRHQREGITKAPGGPEDIRLQLSRPHSDLRRGRAEIHPHTPSSCGGTGSPCFRQQASAARQRPSGHLLAGLRSLGGWSATRTKEHKISSTPRLFPRVSPSG